MTFIMSEVIKWHPREGAVMEISCWNQRGIDDDMADGDDGDVSLLEEHAAEDEDEGDGLEREATNNGIQRKYPSQIILERSMRELGRVFSSKRRVKQASFRPFS